MMVRVNVNPAEGRRWGIRSREVSQAHFVPISRRRKRQPNRGPARATPQGTRFGSFFAPPSRLPRRVSATAPGDLGEHSFQVFTGIG